MSHTRHIKEIPKSQPTIEGAGVHLNRALGYAQVPRGDPFLLLDDFHSNRPSDYILGFASHPHRGIEAITYMLHGQVEHGDCLGHQGVIGPGDVQWVTAGSGIIHQEMPIGQGDGLLWGFQLWANLLASHKMMPPRYRDVRHEQIPEAHRSDGVGVRVICGEVDGVKRPVQDMVIDPWVLDVSVAPTMAFALPVPREHTVLAYVIEGVGHFEPAPDRSEGVLGPEHLILFDDGDALSVAAGEKGARFLLISGRPIGEPIAWGGPIVMNTQAELRMAFEEYRRGTFLKYGPRA